MQDFTKSVDYADAMRRYKMGQGILANAMTHRPRATKGTALGRVLMAYLANKGMKGATGDMRSAEESFNNQRATDLSQALGALREDTPYNQTEIFPGEQPIPGLRNEGSGHNVNAMAQSLMSAKTGGLPAAGLQILAAQPKSQPGFTLSPNQTRYDASGNEIASRSGEITKEEQEKKDIERVKREVAAEKTIFDQTDKLRDEFTAATAPFAKVNDAYSRISASAINPSAAGDMALIFNYMKMLDPGSVVRESEFALAAASGTYGERIQSFWNKAASGERLADTIRADFVDRSKKLYEQANLDYEKRAAEYTRIAISFDLNPSQIIVNQAVANPQINGGGQGGSDETIHQPKTDAEYNAVPSGALFIDPDDGITYRKP